MRGNELGICRLLKQESECFYGNKEYDLKESRHGVSYPKSKLHGMNMMRTNQHLHTVLLFFF